MPYVSVDADLDVEDFLDCCSKKEKEELIELLKEEGLLKPKDMLDKDSTPADEEWFSIVKKLVHNRHRLTNEEESIILRISNKFI